MAAGIALICLGIGVTDKIPVWLSDRPAMAFAVAALCWLAGLWGAPAGRALILLGSSILATGAIVCFGMPAWVNHGSGQDAVGLFAVGFGAVSALLSILCFVTGALAMGRRPKPVRNQWWW